MTKSYYVNGYNFPPTEMQIRNDMLMHGPVTTEFKCDDNFQVYKEGIMVQEKAAPERPPQGQVHAQKASEANYTAAGSQPEQPKPAELARSSSSPEDLGILAANHGDLEYVQTQSSDVLPGSADPAVKHSSPARRAAKEPATTSHVESLAQSHSQMAHQALDHTIFLVGWGFDKQNNLPYWIVRNSYGDSWGMRGDFHVRRGKDDFGVESELSAYQLELVEG